VPLVGNTVINRSVAFLIDGNLSWLAEDGLISVAAIKSISFGTFSTFIGGGRPINTNPVILWVRSEVTGGTGVSSGTSSAEITTLGTSLGGGIMEVSWLAVLDG
jgi:hypothetical protein